MNAAIQSAPHKLDEVMLAMDVVDTLRHEAGLLERDLSAPDREDKLIARLREIYDAQGIEVPDEILREGVKAMDDHRFAYTPQKLGFFSKAYITRGKWGKPLLVFLGMIGMAWSVNYAAFEAPKKVKLKKQHIALTVDLPKSLTAGHEEGLSIAKTNAVKLRLTALYDEGMLAAKSGEYKTAYAADKNLTQLNQQLAQTYTLRIVSRPRELSGVVRGADDNARISNFYLIVEGIGASGKPVPVRISSQEDQREATVKIWGVRVPKPVFDKVAADKRDDQIIQNSVIGAKHRGYLAPEYSVDVSGGLILEW